MTDVIYRNEYYKLNGAFFEVYKDKGCGFLEEVYQECLEIELDLQGIEFKAQYPLKLKYPPLRKQYIPDFICDDKIIIETKAVKSLSDEQRAQLQNNLKATGYKLGLRINFGHYPQVEIERIAN